MCLIEYLGSAALGWQYQPGLNTIELHFLKAIQSMTGLTPEHIDCAGRTDKNVHATGQVIGFSTHSILLPARWITGLNHFLPHWVRVIDVKVLEDQSLFHPRFSALSRTYRYYIKKSLVVNPLYQHEVTPSYIDLDIDQLNQTAKEIIGTHDFTAFRSGSCQAHSPIKTCLDAQWYHSNGLVVFKITATAFLHHMVRYLVGAQLRVAKGDRDLAWFQKLIMAQEKQDDCASPYGLYLCHVQYRNESPIHWSDRRPWFDSNNR